ncbi:biofilm formation/cell division transcriptional regulator BrpA [Streptococcus pluranimalium]|uniref:Biofilm regulatory protein A n=1 Tax=Streptococcus pluranimalium TaxID=82348 RepID=A0A345VI40_9STRE|nr:LCP family protein [Streptococcus pluranimalium]AXJ12392.1 Biofilm regulatory protein A [Streptococcus pluranimalium]
MKLGKKILLMILLIITTTFVAAGVYLGSAYIFSTDALSKTFKGFEGEKVSKAIDKTEPFSILLMGVDTGTTERSSTWEGNSDSMILVTVNPETQKTTMTSLERDILVKLKGPASNDQNGEEAKLNAAYAAGGARMAKMTVEEMLDIDIDYYMQINMQGLMDLVDAVDGITVTNNFDFPISISQTEPDYKATVAPGTHRINGEQALVYSRMRYDDPEGDYGRQKRQREVIQKVMQKVLKLGNSVASYKKILNAVAGNMQTDIKINSSTIPSLFQYADTVQHIKEYQLKGEDADINGGSYQIPTAKALLKIQNTIKKQLGKAVNSLQQLKTNVITYEELYGLDVPLDDSSEEEAVATEDSTGTVNHQYGDETIQGSQETYPVNDGTQVFYNDQVPTDQGYYGETGQPAY